ncbi:MAG: transposase [Clostridiales bacterium]|nr:transposase [Clostridiales bacterium]
MRVKYPVDLHRIFLVLLAVPIQFGCMPSSGLLSRIRAAHYQLHIAISKYRAMISPEKESKMEKDKYSPEHNAKIVLEILKEELSISETASRENITKNQLQNWKREFIENAARVFSQNKIEKDSKKEAWSNFGAWLGRKKRLQQFQTMRPLQ